MDLVAGRSVAAERRPTRHIDWVLLAIVLALVVVGMFLLYSATNQTLRADGFDPFERVKRQVMVVIAGSVLLVLVASFDYRFFKVYAGFFYAAGLFFVALLLIPGVASETGAPSGLWEAGRDPPGPCRFRQFRQFRPTCQREPP